MKRDKNLTLQTASLKACYFVAYVPCFSIVKLKKAELIL